MDEALHFVRDHRELIEASSIASLAEAYFSTHARKLELDHRLEDQATLVDTTPDDFRRQPHWTWRFTK